MTQKKSQYWYQIRDRPFNLQGVGYGFCFVQNFFLSRKARIFPPEFNIKLYDKNSESDYYFFLNQNQNIFFSNIGNQNIFLDLNCPFLIAPSVFSNVYQGRIYIYVLAFI